MNKRDIRRQVRQQRRALSPLQRRHAARQLRRQVVCSGLLLSASRIAIYLVNDGEIDTLPLIKAARRMGKQLYLPVLHPLRKGHLAFVRYDKHTRMRNNRFGIPEPVFEPARAVAPMFLDTLFMPLVAFDDAGNRLGMGGGFYDRSLAACQRMGLRPRLIGCAHEFQRIDAVPAEPWDIPLTAIATNARVRRFRS